jgi:hypothetical protein
MPDRSSSRRAIRPFMSLPRHRRRSAVIALHGRMLRHAYYTGSTLFDSNQLSMDPEEPDRLHTWVDIVFPGLDRFMLWNAELITTEMAKHDLASSRADDEMSAKLEAAGEVYEPRMTSHLIPRKRPGAPRMYRVEFAPEKHYDCLDGQTYAQAREALEAELMRSLPTPPERFEIDRGYAYGIGLHAVINVKTFDTLAIEQTITLFRELGEKNWLAE